MGTGLTVCIDLVKVGVSKGSLNVLVEGQEVEGVPVMKRSRGLNWALGG